MFIFRIISNLVLRRSSTGVLMKDAILRREMKGPTKKVAFD